MSSSIVPSPAAELPRVVKAVRTKAPPVPRDVQLRALETTAKYVRLASAVYGRSIPMPQVAFDLRGRTAGQAFPGRHLIRLNAVLLVENEADFHADTIPHEVAHLVALLVYGNNISAHGREWQAVMHKFGVAPRRTHDYDVTNSAVGGVHHYICGCGRTFALGAKKHRQAARGKRICASCHTVLRPAGAGATGPVNAPRPARPPLPAPRPVRPVVSAPPVSPRLRSVLPPQKPPAPAPLATRPATPAQLQFALSLAHRLGIALQPEHVASFAQCHAFIERHKVVAAVRPTERQLQYARDIARRRGLGVPAEALADSRKLSAWIERNR